MLNEFFYFCKQMECVLLWNMLQCWRTWHMEYIFPFHCDLEIWMESVIRIVSVQEVGPDGSCLILHNWIFSWIWYLQFLRLMRDSWVFLIQWKFHMIFDSIFIATFLIGCFCCWAEQLVEFMLYFSSFFIIILFIYFHRVHLFVKGKFYLCLSINWRVRSYTMSFYWAYTYTRQHNVQTGKYQSEATLSSHYLLFDICNNFTYYDNFILNSLSSLNATLIEVLIWFRWFCHIVVETTVYWVRVKHSLSS